MITMSDRRAARNDGIAFVVSLVAVALVLAGLAGAPLGPVRVAAGLVAGLFAPGYLLLRATSGGQIRGVLRFVLPLPLTLALAAIVGVVVEATPSGLRGDTAALVLSLCTLGFAAAAVWRGVHPVTLARRDARPSVLDLVRPRTGPSRVAVDPSPLSSSLLLSAAAIIALGVAALSIHRAVEKSADPRGEIALTGRLGSVAPTASGGIRAGVELTVINHRAAPLDAVLRVAVVAGRESVRRRRVTVAPRARRTVRMTLGLPCTGEVRAALSAARVAPRRVTLRVRCPPA